MESELAANNTIDSSVTSATSPACVEGKGIYPSLMSLTATSTGSGLATNGTVLAAPDKRWYANVPLDYTNAMSLVVTSESGGLVLTQQVKWVSTSVLNGGSINIRKNDSLLLTAAPTGATNGDYVLTVGGVAYTNTPSASLPYAFTNAGSYTVTGVYTSGSTTLSNAMTVTALDCSLPQNQIGRAHV